MICVIHGGPGAPLFHSCHRMPMSHSLFAARSLFRILCALLLASLSMQASFAAESPVALHDAADGLSLVGRAGFYIDADGGLSIDAIRSAQYDARFALPQVAVHNGTDGRPYWFKFSVSQATAGGDWLLAVPSTAADDLQFFGPYDVQGNLLAAPVHTGQLLPYSTRPLADEHFVFRIDLPTPGNYTFYLRAVSTRPQLYAFSIWDIASYHAASKSKLLFDGLCYGILLGMLIYNLNLAFIFKTRNYWYYLLACTSALLAIFSLNGHTAHYLLPDMPLLAKRVLETASPLWITCSILFGRNVLDLARFAPRIYLLTHVLLFASVATVVLALCGVSAVAVPMVLVLAVALAVLMFLGGVIGLRQGFQPAAWYLFGMAVLFVTILAVVSTYSGIIKANFFLTNSLQFGLAVEAVIYSIAVGSRVRLLRREQAALEERARQLGHAVETDALTGLANRSGLNKRAAELLAQPGERALMMLDLDHFKPVNDSHGHEAGDHVLRTIAKRLLTQIRPEDTVARVGGDEFVILFGDVLDRTTLETIAERILAVVTEPVEYGGQRFNVSGSLGIATVPGDGHSLTDLMNAADSAMYGIKKSGRGAFAFHTKTAG